VTRATSRGSGPTVPYNENGRRMAAGRGGAIDANAFQWTPLTFGAISSKISAGTLNVTCTVFPLPESWSD
jgi:hypothetical protein